MGESQQRFYERLAQVFKQETQGRLETMRLMLDDAEIVESTQAALAKLLSLQMEVHSLKGAARSVERHDIEILCQDAETLLINSRERECALSAEVLSGLRELIDYLDRVVLQSSTETVGMDSTSLHMKLGELVRAAGSARTVLSGKPIY